MPRILLIDDDLATREWVTNVLVAADYKVDSLAEAEGATRLLSLGLIDLALVDYHLPGLDGLGLLRELRRSGNSTPVIILTADASQQVAVQCFRTGAADFIAKPIDADYLKIVIARTLQTHATTLKNVAFRALAYAQHKPACIFHQDRQGCDCGLKEIFDDIRGF